MTTLTGPATNTAVRATGTMSFEQATVATGALANAASKATVSAAQQVGARLLNNYARYAAGSGVAGTLYGALTPLEPSDADISFNPITTSFEVGNLLGATSYIKCFDFPKPITSKLVESK